MLPKKKKACEIALVVEKAARERAELEVQLQRLALERDQVSNIVYLVRATCLYLCFCPYVYSVCQQKGFYSVCE